MLVKYLMKKWPVLLLYMAVVVIAPIVNTRGGFVSAEMMDYAQAADYPAFVRTLMFYMIFWVGHGLLLFAIQAVRAKLISYCRRDLRQEMFEKIISTDNSYFSKPDTGMHIAAFSNDITILETKYFNSWLEVVESILAAATAAVAIFTLNTSMAVIIFVGEVFSIVLCYIIRRQSITKNRIYIEKLARFTQKIKDYFSAFQTIRNYSVEDKIKKRFIHINNDTEHAKDEADMAITFANILAMVCNSIIKFLLVSYGIVLIIKGEITFGLIYAAYQFTDRIVGPMHTIISDINSIESVNSIVNRIKNITEEANEETKHEDIELKEPASITLDNVSVVLDHNRVLNNISHTFLPGKKYLIIGSNGAGKSTLLKLLKRSMDEFEGSITINGHDIRDFSYKSLSNIVSYINESVSLITDTVKKNIALYRDVSDEQIDEVVKKVGLQVNLDRVVRDGERNLSSGETRRIEIARSLINRANVIIYDEAISTLDIPTAYEIEKTLLSLQEQTVIFVSHNFSGQLIGEYDEIILMEKGEITEYGTHEQLMQSSDDYRRIMKIKNG